MLRHEIKSTYPSRGLITTYLKLKSISGESGDSSTGGPNKDSHTSVHPSSKKSTSGGSKKDGSGGTHLICPKCGDPTTHVETFVC